MGLKFPLFGKRDEVVASTVGNNKDNSICLTPVGRQKAEQFSLEGPKFDVLATLLEDGTQSIGEIAPKTNMSANKVREVCKSLAKNGYVKFLKV